jgi:outer membrane murein-binding lipoprotein Lpp
MSRDDNIDIEKDTVDQIEDLLVENARLNGLLDERNAGRGELARIMTEDALTTAAATAKIIEGFDKLVDDLSAQVRTLNRHSAKMADDNNTLRTEVANIKEALQDTEKERDDFYERFYA